MLILDDEGSRTEGHLGPLVRSFNSWSLRWQDKHPPVLIYHIDLMLFQFEQ